MNPLFQKALHKSNSECPPIWFMRQAGRYHSHYQALRKKHSFIDLCKIPELAAEVALGPIQDFDYDVSILFSDLLFPLEAMGMGLSYEPGPKLGWQIRSLDDLKRLKPWAEALPDLHFQGEAVKLTRKKLPTNKSLIGFVGGPWTLFSYAVQGGHDGNLILSKKFLKPAFQKFCENLMPLLKANIDLQLKGGAELVMIFDTSAGELSPSLYQESVAPYLVDLAQAFPKKLGYYSKGTHWNHLKNQIWSASWAGLGVDHRWDLPELLQKESVGFLQGNFDQALLHAETSDLEKYIEKYLETFLRLDSKLRTGWVCGLGHGVLPETPEKHVHLFIQKVRKAFA